MLFIGGYVAFFWMLFAFPETRDPWPYIVGVFSMLGIPAYFIDRRTNGRADAQAERDRETLPVDDESDDRDGGDRGSG